MRYALFCHILQQNHGQMTEDIGQAQKLLQATHPLILVIIFAEYGKNSFRTAHIALWAG